MLDMFKPEKIIVMLKSIKDKIKNERSFIDIYEQNLRRVEKSESLISEVGSASTVVILFALALIIASSLLMFQKTRAFIKDKIVAYKKKMIWNGVIVFL